MAEVDIFSSIHEEPIDVDSAVSAAVLAGLGLSIQNFQRFLSNSQGISATTSELATRNLNFYERLDFSGWIEINEETFSREVAEHYLRLSSGQFDVFLRDASATTTYAAQIVLNLAMAAHSMALNAQSIANTAQTMAEDAASLAEEAKAYAPKAQQTVQEVINTGASIIAEEIMQTQVDTVINIAADVVATEVKANNSAQVISSAADVVATEVNSDSAQIDAIITEVADNINTTSLAAEVAQIIADEENEREMSVSETLIKDVDNWQLVWSLFNNSTLTT